MEHHQSALKLHNDLKNIVHQFQDGDVKPFIMAVDKRLEEEKVIAGEVPSIERIITSINNILNPLREYLHTYTNSEIAKKLLGTLEYLQTEIDLEEKESPDVINIEELPKNYRLVINLFCNQVFFQGVQIQKWLQPIYLSALYALGINCDHPIPEIKRYRPCKKEEIKKIAKSYGLSVPNDEYNIAQIKKHLINALTNASKNNPGKISNEDIENFFNIKPKTSCLQLNLLPSEVIVIDDKGNIYELELCG